jgi:hypothetical protein
MNIQSTADTRFLDPGFGDNGTAPTVANELVAPRSGTLRNFFIRHNTGAGNGNNVVYTVQINGVDTTITATLATGAVGQASDLVHSAAVVQGQRITVKAVKAASIGGGGVNAIASMELA